MPLPGRLLFASMMVSMVSPSPTFLPAMVPFGLYSRCHSMADRSAARGVEFLSRQLMMLGAASDGAFTAAPPGFRIRGWPAQSAPLPPRYRKIRTDRRQQYNGRSVFEPAELVTFANLDVAGEEHRPTGLCIEDDIEKCRRILATRMAATGTRVRISPPSRRVLRTARSFLQIAVRCASARSD